MKKIVFLSLSFLLISLNGVAQEPNFQINTGNKFINFKKSIISNDFYNVSQLRIGTYMTLGSYGLTNGSWIGSNAILDYSSYGERGSLGNKNLFVPAWNQGTALVISPSFVDGNFTGYTHKWNQSSSRVDILDFTPSWNLGPEKTYFNSNVGIGTTNPTNRLTIFGNEADKPSLLIRNASYTASDTAGTSSLQFGFSNQLGPKIEAAKKTRNTTSLNFYTEYGYNTPQLGLSIIPSAAGSNVGIGTTDTKGFKLGVKGKIAAEEVKVALYNTWPDFVFEDDYKLPTLQEVAHHIQEKGHLENIPSATEVAENGIQLGEMNAKLLQKIEELTLYMIEQNKKTDALVEEVKALKEKNIELEKKMN